MTDWTLNVKVRSFSYKKRDLKDDTGHGIGFVFDMRGIDNPGRIDSMKVLTGKDAAVIEYLENETRMPEFLQHIRNMLDITVSNYIERGFTLLTINFGCTGGQHRSVYAAEATAQYLQSRYPVNVELEHLERETWVH